MLLVLGISGLLLYGGWCTLLLSAFESAEIANWTRDTAGYFRVADFVLEHGRYPNGDEEIAWAGLKRTPGYPLLAAGASLLDGRVTVLLLLQALLATVTTVLTAWLTWTLFGCRFAALVAGLSVLLSPQALTLSGQLVSETSFTAALVVGLAALVQTSRQSRPAWTGLATVAFVMALLIRPSLLPVALLPVIFALWALLRWPERHAGWNWRTPAAIYLAGLLTVLGWSAYNHSRTGVFTYSTVGALAMRIYYGIQIEAYVELGGPTNGVNQYIHERRPEITRRLYRAEPDGPPDYAARLAEINREARELIVAHPTHAWSAFRTNVHQNLEAHPPFLWEQQLAPYPRLLETATAIAKGLHWLYRLSPLVLLTGGALLLRRAWVWPAERWRTLHVFMLIGAFVGLFLYFALTAGITYWGGGRFAHPGMFALAVAVAGSMTVITRAWQQADAQNAELA